MAYNHGREDRKWRIWKEAEEKLLRECGVDEATIEQIRIADRADFNSNRRFYRWTNDVAEYLEDMADRVKAYTLREESTESGTRYFISFKDGQGKSHELEVSEQFFMEFRQMERRNRNLLQWDERHREFNEVWDETLNRRALKLPKSIEEQMIEAERAELLCKAVDGLPEIQRRRFLLYYEYEFNFYQIAAMEHCTASAIQKSVAIAKEKVKAEMKKYLQP